MGKEDESLKICGCELGEIAEKKFVTVATPYAEYIIEGMERSGVKYSAKYNGQKLTVAYSLNEHEKVGEILAKANSPTAALIERIRKNSSTEDHAQLMPEIAEVMEISVSNLESRPAEMRIILAQTYVNCWYCDKATMARQLARVTELGYLAEKVTDRENSRVGENETENAKNQNRVLQSGVIFNREMLRQEAERIRLQNRKAVMQNKEEQMTYEKR